MALRRNQRALYSAYPATGKSSSIQQATHHAEPNADNINLPMRHPSRCVRLVPNPPALPAFPRCGLVSPEATVAV